MKKGIFVALLAMAVFFCSQALWAYEYLGTNISNKELKTFETSCFKGKWVDRGSTYDKVFRAGDTVRMLSAFAKLSSKARFRVETWKDGEMKGDYETDWKECPEAYFFESNSKCGTPGRYENRIFIDEGGGFCEVDRIPFFVLQGVEAASSVIDLFKTYPGYWVAPMTQPVSRAEVAFKLVNAAFGGDDLPSPTGERFVDVPTWHWAAAWIEELANKGVTKGCDETHFCPMRAISRAEMSVLLLRARFGKDYAPPLANGIFEDVPRDFWAADWIEAAYGLGITNGCQEYPLKFCPDMMVTREELAAFLNRTF